MKTIVGRFGDKHTPKQVLLDALNEAERMEHVVVIFKTPEGFVEHSWSDGTNLERIGMLHAAIDRQCDFMKEQADDD